ncbi:MAG TPA: hypothetical protein PKA13_00915 [Geminicoccaceae bacterium]|nr:hypothetical protein [Geminicoccus sp.]HMU48299.1 hypothetical protein [Geminicoccaceae bacterium]
MSESAHRFASRRQEVIEPPRPHGLVERLPVPAAAVGATYAKADGAPVDGDRRRRRRTGREPWRGRFVDLVG